MLLLPSYVGITIRYQAVHTHNIRVGVSIGVRTIDPPCRSEPCKSKSNGKNHESNMCEKDLEVILKPFWRSNGILWLRGSTRSDSRDRQSRKWRREKKLRAKPSEHMGAINITKSGMVAIRFTFARLDFGCVSHGSNRRPSVKAIQTIECTGKRL